MNKERRKELEEIAGAIMDVRMRLESVKDEEQDAFDALPEGFQRSDKGEAMEEAIQNMEDAIGQLEDAQSSVENIS